MGKLTKFDIQQNYKDEALKLLLKHDEPTIRNVHVHLCMRDHCPVEHCELGGGFRQGMECGHVLRVKHLVDRIIQIANGG